MTTEEEYADVVGNVIVGDSAGEGCNEMDGLGVGRFFFHLVIFIETKVVECTYISYHIYIYIHM